MSEHIKYTSAKPSGWELINFNDACKSISLNGIKIKQKEYQQNGYFPVVDQGHGIIGGYYDKDELVVSGEPPFIIFGDHTKVIKYVNFKFIAGADGVKVLKPMDYINPSIDQEMHRNCLVALIPLYKLEKFDLPTAVLSKHTHIHILKLV